MILIVRGIFGIAENLKIRIKSHVNRAKNYKHNNKLLESLLLTKNYCVDVLFQDTRENILQKEIEFRPRHSIGLNIVPGGEKICTLGLKMSDDFRRKRSLYMLNNTIAKSGKGKPKTLEHKEKISKSNSKPKQSKWITDGYNNKHWIKKSNLPDRVEIWENFE